MNKYTRTTRECSVSQLHPSLSTAIREYFQTQDLGDLDSGTLLCCETISVDRNPGKLDAFLDDDRDTTIHLATLLTTEWLIWARSGDQSDPLVIGANLKTIQVRASVSRRTKDMQLEITGFINNSKTFVRGELELGPELAAQKFCEEVVQAVSKNKPPAKRIFPKWMGY